MAFVYSCCFWFSLRLSGIMIGVFSLAFLMLLRGCLMYTHSQQVKDVVGGWIDNLELGYYIKNFLENIKADPKGYCSLAITYTCIYILVAILFVYGAYKCNNPLMIAFIIMEATRLVSLTILIANFLLLLKQNTMDIGLLIGASVAGGFFLLGMFYLWICAINLPILINEMKHDEQADTINKLKQLLEVTKQRSFTNNIDNVPFNTDYSNMNNMFVVSRNGFNNKK